MNFIRPQLAIAAENVNTQHESTSYNTNTACSNPSRSATCPNVAPTQFQICINTSGCYWDADVTKCKQTVSGQYKTDASAIQDCTKPTSANFVGNPSELGHHSDMCQWQATCATNTYWNPTSYACAACPVYRLKGNAGAQTITSRGPQSANCSTSTLDTACPKCRRGIPNATQTDCEILVYYANAIQDDNTLTIGNKPNSVQRAYPPEVPENPLNLTKWPLLGLSEPASILADSNKDARDLIIVGGDGKQLSGWDCYSTTTIIENRNNVTLEGLSLIKENMTELDNTHPVQVCIPNLGAKCDLDYYCTTSLKETNHPGEGTADGKGRYKCADGWHTETKGNSDVTACKMTGSNTVRTDSNGKKTPVANPTRFCDSKGCFSLPFDEFIGPA